MKILVLSAYHAPSHRRWVDGLVEHLPEHDFRVETQPPRHFPWRSRGNSLYWAFDEAVRDADPDLVVATSMVDLSALRGLVPSLGQIPTLVYYHENQFAYPTRDDETHANLLVTNLYTALAADRVVFNSEYNRDSFLRRAGDFLDYMPDQVPEGVVEAVRDGSTVLPVPLDDGLFETEPPDRTGIDEPIRLVWNHRWEYDKAPDRFFRALFALEDDSEFRLVVLGQQFRETPDIFDEARRRLDDRIDHWGWVDDRDAYLEWLRRSDVVVSTAIHDFQGLAVQEAVCCGCLPVLPDRVAYPDFFDGPHLYDSKLDDPEFDAQSLADRLRALLADPSATRARSVPDLDEYRWSRMADRYDRLFEETVDSAVPADGVG